MKSDCSTIVKYLTNPKAQRTAFGFIIYEALEAARRLPRVEFQQIGRESNALAHELAQLAVVWRGRFPDCVERCVAQDVNTPV